MMARFDQAVMIAWHTEAFARQKKMQPLEKVLKRQKPKDPEQEARQVAAALNRMAKKATRNA